MKGAKFREGGNNFGRIYKGLSTERVLKMAVRNCVFKVWGFFANQRATRETEGQLWGRSTGVLVEWRLTSVKWEIRGDHAQDMD